MKTIYLFVVLELFTAISLGLLGVYYIEPMTGFTMGIPETLVVFYLFAQIGILTVGYFLCKEYAANQYYFHACTTSFLWMSLSALIVLLIQIFILESRIVALIPIIVSIIGFNTQISNQKND